MPPSQLPTKPDIFFKNKTSCKVPGVSTRTGWCFTLGTSIKLLDSLSQNLTLSKNGDLKRIYSSFFLKKSRGDFLKNTLQNCFFGFHFVLVTTFHICLNHSYVPAFVFWFAPLGCMFNNGPENGQIMELPNCLLVAL